MIDNRLLEMLVCPKCKEKLEFKRKDNKLVCLKCKLAYRIEEDIPVMLLEEAEKIEDGDN